jgi:GNAT superfamily N-acetyltransferase
MPEDRDLIAGSSVHQSFIDTPSHSHKLAGMPLRLAQPADLAPLAQLWCDGWMEAHAAHVPDALLSARTPDSFHTRLLKFGNDLRVAGPAGAPTGLCAVRGAELNQLFVAPSARGTGLAADLLANGEARLATKGVTSAFLLCLIENERAARFYEKQGWQNLGPRPETVDTLDGPFKI